MEKQESKAIYKESRSASISKEIASADVEITLKTDNLVIVSSR